MPLPRPLPAELRGCRGAPCVRLGRSAGAPALRPGGRLDMVVKADRLAVAHPPDMRVAGPELVAGLGLAAEGPDHDKVLAGVDERIRLGLELIEILGDRREDVVGDALSTTEGTLGSASAAWLVPLDLRIEGLQDCGNVSAVERLIGVAHGADVLLGHRSSFACSGPHDPNVLSGSRASRW